MIDPALRLGRQVLSTVKLQPAVEKVRMISALDPRARGVVVVAADVLGQGQMAVDGGISPVFGAQISNRVRRRAEPANI